MTSNAFSVQAQSIIYNNNPANVERLIHSVRASFNNAKSKGIVNKLVYKIGDCSPQQVIKDPDSWCKNLSSDNFEVVYVFFNENLGHGGGHNRLNAGSAQDIVGIINPDVTVSPNLIGNLCLELEDEKIGMAEANQIPMEHPKNYNLETRETTFGSGCCFLMRQSFYNELDGFDHESFFMYCDDVDLSWRVRLSGKKIIFVADTCVYHDHRLQPDGTLKIGWAEFHYSALGAIILAYKWGRDDIAKQHLENMGKNKDYEDVVKEFNEIVKQKGLPEVIAGAEEVRIFSPTGYADYRWTN